MKIKRRQWVIDNRNFDPENEQECIEAVKEYGCAIQYINNPGENIIKEALNKNPDCFIHIKF